MLARCIWSKSCPNVTQLGLAAILPTVCGHAVGTTVGLIIVLDVLCDRRLGPEVVARRGPAAKHRRNPRRSTLPHCAFALSGLMACRKNGIYTQGPASAETAIE